MSMGAQGAIGEHLRQYYNSFRDELDKLDRQRLTKAKNGEMDKKHDRL